MTEKDLISTYEAAEIIGVCRTTIENFRRRNWLHPVRLANGHILFVRQEVEKLRESLLRPKGKLVQASQAGRKKKLQSLKIDCDQTLFKPEVWNAVRKYQAARKVR